MFLREIDARRHESAFEEMHTLPRPGKNDREAQAEYCRKKAEELRTVAGEMALQETRETLLRLAHTYDAMAETLAGMCVPQVIEEKAGP
jgi:hypothetical protein